MSVSKEEFLTYKSENNGVDEPATFQKMFDWLGKNATKMGLFTEVTFGDKIYKNGEEQSKTKSEETTEAEVSATEAENNTGPIVCKVSTDGTGSGEGSFDFLTLNQGKNSTNGAYVIKLSNNSAAISSDYSYETGRYFCYGIKCGNTLSLAMGKSISNSSNFEDGATILSICKSHNEKTAIVTCWTHSTNETSNASASINHAAQRVITGITPDITDVKKVFVTLPTIINGNNAGNTSISYKNVLSPVTVFAPIILDKTDGDYIDEIQYMVYAQTRTEAVLTINGQNYYTNGLWSIEDKGGDETTTEPSTPTESSNGDS